MKLGKRFCDTIAKSNLLSCSIPDWLVEAVIMSKKSYFLVPTADESTWKFDRPILFLGEWCLRFDRKVLWQKMDFVLAAPYGCGKAKKDSDSVEAKRLEQKYFPLLCRELNEFHQVNYGERFWKILLGSWFERYSTLILNRVRTLESCLLNYSVSDIYAYPLEGYSLAAADSYAATHAVNDDTWNHFLCLRILELFQSFQTIGEKALKPETNRFKIQTENDFPLERPQWKEVFFEIYRRISLRMARDTDAMILSSYLSLKAELQIQMLLRQIPKWILSPRLDDGVEPSIEVRKVLADKLDVVSDELLEDIFKSLIFQLLPICYLEGFSHLNKKMNERKWPSKPKFIFTSNSFEYDEVFKLWAARKVLDKVPVIFGQHGNNYGTHRYLNPSVEETTCDKFITWGWSDNLGKTVPAFMFRNAGKKFRNGNPSGKLLLIETEIERRFRTWDTTHEFRSYFNEQLAFVKYLNLKPKQELLVRLPLSSRENLISENEIWGRFGPEIQIESGIKSIENLISKSRIVVHSYDSTGILETLSRNIPTLAFWQNNLDHLRDNVIEDYQMLIDAGIIHLTPKSAASKVNEIWDCVDEWWQSKDVQEARSKFCMKYAQSSQRPVRNLKRILLETVNMIDSKQ